MGCAGADEPQWTQGPSQPPEGGEDLGGDQGSFCMSAKMGVLATGMERDSFWLGGGFQTTFPANPQGCPLSRAGADRCRGDSAGG